MLEEGIRGLPPSAALLLVTAARLKTKGLTLLSILTMMLTPTREFIDLSLLWTLTHPLINIQAFQAEVIPQHCSVHCQAGVGGSSSASWHL